MSNLAQTQAEWTRIGREMCFYLGQFKLLDDIERKFDTRRNRIQIIEENSVNAFTSAWTLAGVVIGTNTDENGLIYVRITDETPGAAQATVDLYKAAGGSGGNKVATGSAADNGTITLAAANTSGLTGAVKLAVVSASESDDKHRLRLFPDFPVRARSIFDGTKSEHGDLLGDFMLTAALLQSAVVQMKARVAASFGRWVAGRLANFLGSSQGSPINASVTSNGGLLTTTFAGVFEDLRADMVDEATAGAQTVLKNVVTASAPVADTHNQGKGSLSTPTMNEWGITGTITLVCVDGTIGSEQFLVTQRDPATNRIIQARNPLTVKKTFADPDLGISAMLLSRTFTFTGSANDFSTTASDWTVNGETASNTSGGIIYLKAVAVSSNWKIQGWSTSGFVAGTQVFESDVGAAAAVVNFSAIGGSGLSGVLKIGSAPTNGNTGSINLNPFTTQNSTPPGVPDKFTVAVTRTSSGEIQDRIAEFYDYAINSAASNPTLPEGLATAGTFPPYAVRDA